MARTRNLGFVKGQLGDIGFRQGYVTENGVSKKATIAFQVQRNVANPRTAGQTKQRTAFSLVRGLASLLLAFLRIYFTSTINTSNAYTAFISKNLKNAIHVSEGVPFIDFAKLVVTNGSFKARRMKVWAPIEAVPDDCNCGKTVTWDYDWKEGIYGDQWNLAYVGVSVDENGQVDDYRHVVTEVTYGECGATLFLPECGCCKTYYYAFFVNTESGEASDSHYIGTCETEHDVYDPTQCAICILDPVKADQALPPSEDVHNCDAEAVDKDTIVYTGDALILGKRGFESKPTPNGKNNSERFESKKPTDADAAISMNPPATQGGTNATATKTAGTEGAEEGNNLPSGDTGTDGEGTTPIG